MGGLLDEIQSFLWYPAIFVLLLTFLLWKIKYDWLIDSRYLANSLENQRDDDSLKLLYKSQSYNDKKRPTNLV